MLFLMISIIVFALFTFVLYKMGDRNFLSRGVLGLLMFSIIVNVALGVAYAAPFGDGIGINNDLAYWVITDDKMWTVDLFRTFYEGSTIFSLVLLALYCGVVVFEARRAR